MSSSAGSVARSYAPRYVSPAGRPAPRTVRGAESVRPSIQVVSQSDSPARSHAWPIVLAALFLLIVAIAVPLVINTQMAETSYAIRDAQVQLAELEAQRIVLEADLLEASSPQALEQRARALGLVPAGAPGTVSLVDGTVTGGEPAQ